MDDQNDRSEYSREPTLDDLVLLCRHLNEAGVKYVVIGGFAVILSGYIRTTGDIDLLVESSLGNVDRIKNALLYLPDQAVREVASHEVAEYTVVRVADEIVVDLMHKACEVTYEAAERHIQYYELEGVKIPLLKPDVLIQTKLGIRPKDIQDRMFLEELLNQQKASEPTTSTDWEGKHYGRFRRFFQKIRRLLFGAEKE
jgi:hypothetical protein